MSQPKHIAITGGTGGLGTTVSRKFLAAGWEVTALGSADLNLLDQAATSSYFSGKKIDTLVCCAGLIRDKPLSRMEETEWDEVFSVNFTAALNCANAVLPHMLENGRGHMIFISSYAAIHPAVGQAAYAAAKSALHGLTVHLASLHGPSGIRVNAILPGFLETPMTAAVSEKRKETVRHNHFLRRFNQPEQAADFIHFLETSLPHTSGQTFQLDSRTP